MARLPALPGAPRPTGASDGVSVATPSIAGGQRLLGAVGQVADQGFNSGLDDMKRANEVVRLTKEREFNTAISEAQGNLKRNKPGDWVKQISEASASIRERLLANEELAPAVKDNLQRRFQDYEARTIQQVGRDAKIAQISILKDETALRLEGLQSNGQWDEADKFIRESAGTLDLTEPELKGAILENDKRRKRHEMEEKVNEGDEDYFDSLTGISPSEKRRYQAQARSVKMGLKRDALDQIDDAITLNPNIPEDDVKKSLEAVPGITSADAKIYLERFQENAPTPPELRTELRNDVIELRKLMTDPELSYEEYWEAFDDVADELRGRGDAATWLPYTLQSLHPNKFAKARQEQTAKLRKEANERMERSLKRAFETDPEKLDEMERDDFVREAKDRMADWILDNPNANPEELREKAQSIKGEVMGSSLFKKANDYQGRYKSARPAVSTSNESGREVNSLPAQRGRIKDGYAVGKASTYWDTPDNDNGMTSVGIKRKDAPWWKDQKLPTIALAPEVAKSLGVKLPSKVHGEWDISLSRVLVTLPDGRQFDTVYGENGMFKHPNSLNKLIDLSEQFQEVAGVKRGDTLKGVKVRPLI